MAQKLPALFTSGAGFMAALGSGLAQQEAEEGTLPCIVLLQLCKEASGEINQTSRSPVLRTTTLKPVGPMTQNPKGPCSPRQKPAQAEIRQNQLPPTTPVPSHSWNNGQGEEDEEDWSQATNDTD